MIKLVSGSMLVILSLFATNIYRTFIFFSGIEDFLSANFTWQNKGSIRKDVIHSTNQTVQNAAALALVGLCF